MREIKKIQGGRDFRKKKIEKTPGEIRRRFKRGECKVKRRESFQGGKLCFEGAKQGKKICPCEKRLCERLPCDAAVQVCEATYEKMMNCGKYRCPERCY